jgi:hypothetical protein
MVKGPGGRVSEAASAAQPLGPKDYAANMEALHKQFDSLMQAIGGPVAQALIPDIQKLTDVLNKAKSSLTCSTKQPQWLRLIPTRFKTSPRPWRLLAV